MLLHNINAAIANILVYLNSLLDLPGPRYQNLALNLGAYALNLVYGVYGGISFCKPITHLNYMLVHKS